MDNQEIWNIAFQQSALDYNCRPEDFLEKTPKVFPSVKNEKARVYLSLPLSCSLVSYGNNVVAQTSWELREEMMTYLTAYPTEHCLETPHLHVLDGILGKYGQKVCFMAEYFLPDLNELRELSCDYELRILTREAFQGLYQKEWSNALCKARKEKDVLCVGAYDGEKLVGLAGCSADCETMYQIGVDVLPEYRRKGIAAAIVTKLAAETLALGKVPFYCAAWCNLKSVRNAIKCGFRPAWVEVTAKSAEFVEEANSRLK